MTRLAHDTERPRSDTSLADALRRSGAPVHLTVGVRRQRDTLDAELRRLLAEAARS